MHTVPVQPRHTPTSVGALMDPGFLRQAVNDMVATTDAEGPEVPSLVDTLKAAVLRALTAAHVRAPAPSKR